jgi:large subunit ribosomal protein L4
MTMNKKEKRAALFGAMSAKVAGNEMVVVDAISATSYKTKAMVAMLNALGAEKKALIVLPAVDPIVVKSCANIPGVKTAVFNTINVYDILNCDTFIVAKAAVEKIEEVYAK